MIDKSDKTKTTYERKKVFISYSWSNQDWVAELAKELLGEGIKVVMDIWDLREGDDKYVFMEKEVSDPSIDKVLIVCDQNYKEKADGRSGGVGTEAQILTPELYSRNNPRKYIPILKEFDENGEPCVPIFLKPKIFVDFSNHQKHMESFERLINVIYDQTLTEKPELGPIPEKILNHESNDYRLRRVSTQINSHIELPHTLANLFQNEFIPEFFKRMKECDISDEWNSLDENYQMVMDKITAFNSNEEKFKDCVRLYIRSGAADASYLADYFSNINVFIDNINGLANRHDVLKYLLIEQFLIVTGELIKQREWDMLKYLVTANYKTMQRKIHFEGLYNPPMSIYNYNDHHDHYNSAVGELLAKRNQNDFNQLWCADVLLFYIGQLRFHRSEEQMSGTWVPTLQIRSEWSSSVPDFSLMENLNIQENMNVLLMLTGLTKEELENAKVYNEFTRFGTLSGVPPISKYGDNQLF